MSFFKRDKKSNIQYLLRGFTLVELLAGIAIVSLLAAIALPAYNNYVVKSRFSEVVSASNPIKSYISVCASDGSCVQNNQIVLDLSTPSVLVSAAVASSVVSAGTPDQLNIPSNEQAIYMVLYEAYQELAATGNPPLTSFADEWSDVEQTFEDGYYSLGTDPNNSANECILLKSSSRGVVSYKCIQVDSSVMSGASALSPNGPYRFVSTSMSPSIVPTYASIDGYTPEVISPAVPAVITPAHTGTVTVPCVGTDGCSPPTKYVLSAVASTSGVITATAQSAYQLNTNTFVLIPSYSSGRVDWTSSGSCKSVAAGSATLC